MNSAARPTAARLRATTRTVLPFAVGLLALVVFGRLASARLPAFSAWVQQLGIWGPLAFVGGYGVATLILVPVALLAIAAGAIFGVPLGMLCVLLGAALGASLAFVAARHVVRRLVESYVAKHPRLMAIDRAVETEGARIVFLLRLSPLLPFVLLNYVLGISRVRYRDYMAGLVGIIPTVAMYVYAGKVAGDLASLAAGAAAPRGPLYYTVLCIGLAATVAASVVITRAASRAAVAATAAGRAEVN